MFVCVLLSVCCLIVSPVSCLCVVVVGAVVWFVLLFVYVWVCVYVCVDLLCAVPVLFCPVLFGNVVCAVLFCYVL